MALPVRSMSLTEAVDTTRSGSAWYFDENGVFQEESTSDVARIDYDPATGNRLGLMSEGASTNLLTYSEDLSNAAWLRSSATIGTPVTFATNISLDQIVETTATSGRLFQSAVGKFAAAGEVLTSSCFARANSRSKCRIAAFQGGSGAIFYADINLSSGTVVTTNNTGAASVDGASIVDVGSSTYRISVTGSFAGSGNVRLYFYMQDDSGNTSYVGDGSSNLYAGGFQLEELPGASSYIPTTSAQVTRAAETHELVSLDPWYRASGYSVAVQYQLAFNADNGGQAVLGFSDADGSDRLVVLASRNGLSTTELFYVQSATGEFIELSDPAPAGYTTVKVATRVAAGDTAASIDGNAAVAGAAGLLPGPATKAVLGQGYDGTGALDFSMYGWIQDLKYTTTLLSDAELATESGMTV